jgi:uncharacterized membrane protein YeaQ/YmgE (transglycosylase-associated protein family)
MTLGSLIEFLLIGALAGWFAGMLTKGSGFGVVGNILVGIVGAFLGGFCFRLLGIVAFGLIGQLIFAVLGALLFLWLLSFTKK